MRLLSIVFILSIICKSFGQVDNSEYEVFALRYATMANKDPVSYVAHNAPDSLLFEPAFMFWLIKNSKGKNILVDAGFVNDNESFKSRYNFENYHRPDSLLQSLGISANDITDIIITHPHRDHIDGIDLFPNAQIWMQKEDFNYFVGEAWKLDKEEHGYMERDVMKIIKANLSKRLNLVDGEKEILPKIKVLTGSRHTFNSQYVVVETNNENIVIASDNALSYFNIEHSVSAPDYATLDTIGYVEQIDKMKNLVKDFKYIIPGHDALVFSIFERVTDDIVKIY